MNLLIVEQDPMVALIDKKCVESIGGIKVYGPAATEWRDVLNQEEIDCLFEREVVEEGLPKGLNPKTLNKVVTYLEWHSDREWTLRSLAKEMHMSNVTIKKYMDYLEEIGKIISDLSTG